jgi:hypothetical protein
VTKCDHSDLFGVVAAILQPTTLLHLLKVWKASSIVCFEFLPIPLHPSPLGVDIYKRRSMTPVSQDLNYQGIYWKMQCSSVHHKAYDFVLRQCYHWNAAHSYVSFHHDMAQFNVQLPTACPLSFLFALRPMP